MRQAAIVVVLVISLLTASCLEVGAPPYTERNFTVGVNEKYTIVADLEAGQIIEGDFSISGQEDYIDFYIKDPFGGLLYSVTAEGSHKFTAKAKYSGAHTLYFENSFSLNGTSRQIALHYRKR
jgi:hypothetical protein